MIQEMKTNTSRDNSNQNKKNSRDITD